MLHRSPFHEQNRQRPARIYNLGGPTTTDCQCTCAQCTILQRFPMEGNRFTKALPRHLYTGGLRLRWVIILLYYLKPRYVETQSSEGSEILFTCRKFSILARQRPSSIFRGTGVPLVRRLRPKAN